MRGVIAGSAMFFETTSQIFRRPNVVAARGAAENINPGHMNLGWAGLEPATNALKGRCSTIELPTRAGKNRSNPVRATPQEWRNDGRVLISLFGAFAERESFLRGSGHAVTA